MADKWAAQCELAKTMANLIHCFDKSDDACKFVQSFFTTMHREWHGVDGHRINKFYYLVRQVVHETFRYIHKREWDDETVAGCVGRPPPSFALACSPAPAA